MKYVTLAYMELSKQNSINLTFYSDLSI